MPKQTMEEGAVFPSPPVPSPTEPLSTEAALRTVIEALDELVQGGTFACVAGVTRFRAGLVRAREQMSPTKKMEEQP